MKILEIVDCLAALAQESRLALLRMLVKRGAEGCTPSQLSERLDIPGPTLSFHLKELQRAGVILARRHGRFRYYSPNYPRMNQLVGFLADNCCGSCGKEGRPSYGSTAAAAPQSKRRRG